MCYIIKTIGFIVKSYIKIVLIIMLLMSFGNYTFGIGINNPKGKNKTKDVYKEQAKNKLKLLNTFQSDFVSNKDVKKLFVLIGKIIEAKKSLSSRISVIEKDFKGLSSINNNEQEVEKNESISLNSEEIEKLQFLLDGIVSE